MASGTETKRTAGRSGEILALLVIVAAVPVAVLGVLLPVNKYSWMADDGATFPPDCDSLAGLFLIPSGIVLACGLLGFGFLLLLRRSALRLAALAISIVMIAAIGCRIPEYLRESARADDLCSK